LDEKGCPQNKLQASPEIEVKALPFIGENIFRPVALKIAQSSLELCTGAYAQDFEPPTRKLFS
jgi:hypothetical protein